MTQDDQGAGGDRLNGAPRKELSDSQKWYLRDLWSRLEPSQAEASQVLLSAESQHSITSPAVVRAFMLAVQWRLCLAVLNEGVWTDTMFVPNDENHWNTALFMLLSMEDGVPYLWEESIREMAEKYAPELPRHQVKDVDWPHECMFWVFSKPLLFVKLNITAGHESGKSLEEEELERIRVLALLIVKQDGDRSAFAISIDNETGQAGISPSFIQLPDDRYPEDVPEQDYLAYSQITKLIGFLQSKILEPRQVYASRGVRRRHPLTLGAPVTVVTLRRKEQELRDMTNQNEEAPDWQFRWMVSGHWRNQWYSSEERHRLKWIDPYLKGPEDKPIKATIYHVKR